MKMALNEPVDLNLGVRSLYLTILSPAEAMKQKMSLPAIPLMAAPSAEKAEQARMSRNAGIIMLGAHALIEQRKFDMAFELCILALQQDKDCAQAHNGVGICLRQDGEYENAVECFDEAIRIQPAPVFKANRASLLIDCLDLDRGLAELRTLYAEFPDKLGSIGQVSLTCGELAAQNFDPGWKMYAERTANPLFARQIGSYAYPKWDGVTAEPVLVVQEEGPGERIMFGAMIQNLLDAGVTPLIEVTPKFHSFANLFRRSFPGAHVATLGETMAPKSQIIVGDLAQMYRPTIDHFPDHKGYLKPDPARVEELRGVIAGLFGRKAPVVGLSWNSKGVALGKHKSIPPEVFHKIIEENRDVNFINLQYQSDVFDTPLWKMKTVPGVDLDNDFDDLAALIDACDLVIGISNSIGHLAGAVGVPVWLMLPDGHGLNWFWFRDRTDSPWYPSMTLFRQDRAKGWGPLVENVAKELQNFTGNYNATVRGAADGS